MQTAHDPTSVDSVGSSPLELLDAAMHSPAGLEHPYPFLERLVEGSESFIAPDGHAFVYGYGPSTVALRSAAFFKGGEHTSSVSTSFTPEQNEILRRERPPAPGMLSSIDDPDHARLRRLVSVAFTPKAVDYLRDLAHSVLEDVLAALDHDVPVDLVSTLFTDVPSEIVGALIGLPLADRNAFAEMAAVSSVGRDPDATFDEQVDAARARRGMADYVAGMIDDARRTPSDSVVGRLIQLEAEGERINDEEIVSLVSNLHSAGFGTTKRLLGNGVVALLRNPEQYAALRADPTLTRRATDEVLRYDGSVMTVSYWAGEGAEADGTPIEPGALCTIILGAANHDARVFDDPSIFDITRPRSEAPLSFGYGAHYCLGAALARMETDVVLGELARRFPDMELAAEPERVPSFRSRTYRAVEVVLGQPAA